MKKEAKEKEDNSKYEKTDWSEFKSLRISKDKKRLLIFTKDNKAVSVGIGLVVYILKTLKESK